MILSDFYSVSVPETSRSDMAVHMVADKKNEVDVCTKIKCIGPQLFDAKCTRLACLSFAS